MPRPWTTIDGNEAVASVAYRTNEVIAIYPITPSSSIGELADEWSARGTPNIWGTVPQIAEMQSEGGAIGAVHGALQAGALATSFTASQGLLLMIPDLYKIAGELTPFALHVAARTVATHALSIFGDHSDVMGVRQTGVALLASGSVQEAHDFACIAQMATLATRLPFVHFFDGFRTSHEVGRVDMLADEDLRALIDEALVAAHRRRALTPDRPVVRGTAHNPDTYFQAREAVNPFYADAPALVQTAMDRFAARSGRRYRLFDYVGHLDADRVLVMMGSGAETAHEVVDRMVERGQKVGLLKVRLYRPFSIRDFIAALPMTTRAMAVLDRTKEPGAVGEPLYQDVVTALAEARRCHLSHRADAWAIGGRYGLSSKEFTPAMVKTIFDELASPQPKPHFTVGIVDDVSGLSLNVDEALDIEPPDVKRAVFYGLGSDGTVGANKNSIKIIAGATGFWTQGYFVYDSKKSGAVTISHLRFGPRRIRSTYLIRQAHFVACHQFGLLERYDVLERAAPGGVFLLNAPYGPDEVWNELPREVQAAILDKSLHLFVVDADRIAREYGLGSRINTIMQTCFFAIAGVMPTGEAIAKIKEAIEKTYGKRGEEIVRRNHAAVDAALSHLYEVEVPRRVTATRHVAAPVPDHAPEFVRRVTGQILAGKGDRLRVSAFPVDGTWPSDTAQWEKRNLAAEIPIWDETICIQCNKCALVCPHAAIRVKVYTSDQLGSAPAAFKSCGYKGNEFKGAMGAIGASGAIKYTVQIAPEDCTGCSLCVMVCPAKDKSNPRHRSLDMHPQAPLRAQERDNYEFFLNLPEVDRALVKTDIKGSQFLEPLFEYSGACAGCGETPYIKLVTQLFGDRALIANATGCSSIYGGNLPTTPYACNAEGRGPAWANSLFEDNAEFGLGMRLAVDVQAREARDLLATLTSRLEPGLVQALVTADQSTETGIRAQRERVTDLKRALAPIPLPEARRLHQLADFLVRKSVWIVGGDGWAYDIGYGGLDHVLAMGHDVNVLVLDTEVYSNTGGQQSKATPLGAAAKFAVAGKTRPKKDLGLMAMAYGHVYVARVAFGAKDAQTVKALVEAESYQGPSLILGYAHCIAHGYDMAHGLDQQKLAVETGHWPLYRFDPRRTAAGEQPLVLDSPAPRGSLHRYMVNETRFRLVEQQDPERFRDLAAQADRHARERYELYERLAGEPIRRGQLVDRGAGGAQPGTEA